MNLGWFETSLVVRDIEASLAFYEALGFRQESGGVDIRTVTVRRGDCGITLFQEVLDPAETQLHFWQGDVEAIVRNLSNQGVTLEAGWPRTTGDGSAAAMLRDPDGHLIYLINMPVHFAQHPGYAVKAPVYEARRPSSYDKQLGWFELSLAVKDIDTAIAFYRKLGFLRVDDGTIERTATLQNNDCRLGLYEGYLDPAETQLIFWQGDVDAIADTVRRQDLSFFKAPSTDARGAEALMLKDPDGHPLFFINIPGNVREDIARTNQMRA